MTTIAREPQENPMTDTASTATQRQRLAASELKAGAWSHYGPALAIAVGFVIWPAALLVIGIPLVIRATAGKRSQFVRDQSTAALNFVVTYLVVLGVGLAVLVFLGLTAVLILLPAIVGFFVWQIVLLTRAGKAAKAGRQYRYPVTIPVLR
jgi:uncharacterized Tic20 family protein